MRRLSAFAAAVVSAVPLTVFAQAETEPTTRELLEQIKALQARVEQLEQRPPSQAEIDASKAKINADVAAKNAVFLKYDDAGLQLYNHDKTFTMNPKVLVALRYVLNSRDGNTKAAGTGEPGDDDQTSSGFEVRRVKLTTSGNVLMKELSYQVEFTSQPNVNTLALNDAFVNYRLGENSDYFVRGGQFKNPFWHEEIPSDSYSVAVEGALVNETLGGRAVNRVQGVGLIYNNYAKDESKFNSYLTFTDGDRSLNTDFRQTNAQKFGVLARTEYKVFGDWVSYGNLSHLDDPHDLLVAGAAVSTSQGEDTVYRFCTDVQWEFAERWALYGGLLAAQNNRDTGDDTFDTGGLIQMAYIVTRNWEVFGRYDITKFEDEQANGAKSLEEFLVGVNYIFGDNGKFWRQCRLSLDVAYLPEGAPANFLNEDFVQSDGPQIVTRVQFRLLM